MIYQIKIMFKLLDMVGFCITSTTCGIIKKYLNIDKNSNEFILLFEHDFDEDSEYYINDNISDILRLFNILKNNGSLIIKFCPNRTVLIGKKISQIKKDVPLYKLYEYINDPFEEEDLDQILIEPTNLNLKEIFINIFQNNDISFLN